MLSYADEDVDIHEEERLNFHALHTGHDLVERRYSFSLSTTEVHVICCFDCCEYFSFTPGRE